MDMTPEEFDAAAHQLLAAERQGTLRLPVGPESASWGQQVGFTSVLIGWVSLDTAS